MPNICLCAMLLLYPSPCLRRRTYLDRSHIQRTLFSLFRERFRSEDLQDRCHFDPVPSLRPRAMHFHIRHIKRIGIRSIQDLVVQRSLCPSMRPGNAYRLGRMICRSTQNHRQDVIAVQLRTIKAFKNHAADPIGSAIPVCIIVERPAGAGLGQEMPTAQSGVKIWRGEYA